MVFHCGLSGLWHRGNPSWHIHNNAIKLFIAKVMSMTARTAKSSLLETHIDLMQFSKTVDEMLILYSL